VSPPLRAKNVYVFEELAQFCVVAGDGINVWTVIFVVVPILYVPGISGEIAVGYHFAPVE